MGGRGGLTKIAIGVLVYVRKNMDIKPLESGRWRKHLHD